MAPSPIDDKALELSAALLLVVQTVGPAKTELGPAEWANEMAAYTVALIHRSGATLSAEVLEWDDPIDIPCTVAKVENPFVTEGGKTTNLARITIKPHIGKFPTQTPYVDLSSEGGVELAEQLATLVNQDCTVIKRSKYTLDADGQRKASPRDPTKLDSHPYLVGVRSVGTLSRAGGRPSQSAPAPAAPAPAAAAPAPTPAPAAAAPAPTPAPAAAPALAAPAPAPADTPVAAPAATAAPAADPAPVAAAPAPVAAPADATAAAPAPAAPVAGDFDWAKSGYSSAEDAAQTRRNVAAALDELKATQGPEAHEKARTKLRELNLVWPVPKVKATYALQILLDLANPAAVPDVEW